MEYANDAAAQAAFVSNAIAGSQYPPAYSDTYVKATTKVGTSFWPHFATNPTLSLIGTTIAQQWFSADPTNQRFHIDLGSAKVITRIYYENAHDTGTEAVRGAKNFTFWGSNTAAAFAELTYGIDTNWTQLTCDISQFVQHVALNQSDPKYVVVTNTTVYRYYAFKFADCWLGSGYIGVRRIELQSDASLQDYSEATIKQEGSYSLKGVALITDSLNKTLTRTVSPTINLTDKTIIKFDMRASRTGANIKIGIHDSGGTTEITPTIVTANTWQTVVWDISAVANANKDAIDSIIVTIVNADAANTFYIDNMFADVITNYLIHRGRDRFRTSGYSLGN